MKVTHVFDLMKFTGGDRLTEATSYRLRWWQKLVIKVTDYTLTVMYIGGLVWFIYKMLWQ
jgi:hypothetical protein